MKILKLIVGGAAVFLNLVCAHAWAAGERSHAHYQYNDKGQLEYVDDPNDNRTNYSYDALLGRLESVLAPDGGATTYKYDANGNLTDILDPRPEHFLTKQTYNERNELEQIDYPGGKTVMYRYDPNGNLAKVEEVRPAGGNAVWTMTYDELNRLTGKIFPESPAGTDCVINTLGCEQFVYYKNDALKEYKDRKNQRTQYLNYDGNNRLKEARNPLLEKTISTYDDAGNLKTVTDARLKTTEYFYDEMNRVFQIVDPLGHTTEYEYDFNSNVASIQDTRGVSIFKTYTAQNQVELVVDDLGAATTYGYDLAGNLIAVYEPPIPPETQGRYTEYDIDEMHRVEGLKRDGVLVEESAFDKVGNRISRKLHPGNGKPVEETTYAFDVPNRIVTVTPPAGQGSPTTYTFDPAGDLLTQQSGANAKAFTYDKEHQSITKEVNNQLYEFGYDQNGNLVSATSPFINGRMTEEFDHDALNRRTKERYYQRTPNQGASDQAAFDVTVEYNQYDSGGNLTRMTGPAGDVWEFTPDDADRITEIKKNSQPLVGIGYEDNDLVKSTTFKGNAQFGTLFKHDNLNRLESITYQKPGGSLAAGDVIDKIDYTYYNDYNINTITEKAGAQTIQYDGFNRLNSVVDTRGGKTVTYTYDFDNIGNREDIHRDKPGAGALASETGGKFPRNEVSDNGVLVSSTHPRELYEDEYNDKIVVNADVSWPLSPMGRGQVRLNKTDQNNFLQINLRRDLGIITLEDVIDGAVSELDRVNNVSIPAAEIVKIIAAAEGNQIEVKVDSSAGVFELSGQSTVPLTGFAAYHSTDTLMRVVRSDVSLRGDLDSAWQIQSGQWQLEGTYLKGTGQGALIRRGESFWKDIMMDSFLHWPQEPDGVVGVLINMRDNQNFIEVQLNNANDQLRLVETINGAENELARQDGLTIPAGENVNVYVESLGQAIRVLLVSSLGAVELNATAGSQVSGFAGYRTAGAVMEVEGTDIRAALATTYSYDDNVRLSGKVVKQFGDQTIEDVSYSYDEDGRISAITNNGLAGAAGGTEYWYDPFGRRIAKKVGDEIEYSIYSGPNVIQTYKVNGEDVTPYQTFTTTGTDNHLAMEVDGKEYFYLKDHLGSVRYVVDSQGEIANQYQYDPFGQDVNFSKVSGEGAGAGIGPEVPNPFKYTGREYDPESGLYNYRMRYYNPESGRLVSRDPVDQPGQDTFNYVGGDPINYTDPWGMESLGHFFLKSLEEMNREVIEGTNSPTEAAVFSLSADAFGALAGMSIPDNVDQTLRTYDTLSANFGRKEATEILAGGFYKGIEESVGTRDFVRARDYSDEYNGWEQTWFFVQGTSKSFLTVMGALSLAGKIPAGKFNPDLGKTQIVHTAVLEGNPSTNARGVGDSLLVSSLGKGPSPVPQVGDPLVRFFGGGSDIYGQSWMLESVYTPGMSQNALAPWPGNSLQFLAHATLEKVPGVVSRRTLPLGKFFGGLPGEYVVPNARVKVRLGAVTMPDDPLPLISPEDPVLFFLKKHP